MPENQSNWKDLGEETKNLIQDAISTGNFENLSRDVSNIAGRAVKNITNTTSRYQEVVNDRRAYEQRFYNTRGYQQTDYEKNFYDQKQRDANYNKNYRNNNYNNYNYNNNYNRNYNYNNNYNANNRGNSAAGTAAYNGIVVENVQYPAVAGTKYKNISSLKVLSIVGMTLFSIIGFVLALLFGGAMAISSGVVRILFMALMLLPVGCFAGTFFLGRLFFRSARFDSYVNTIGTKDYIEVKKLSAATGKPEKFVLNDLKRFIKSKWFFQGHLDATGTTLITTNKTFDEYNKLMQEQEQVKAEEAAKKKANSEKYSKYTESQQEIFRQADEYIKEIHRCNDEIPGEEISEKIDHMEHSVRMIIERAKEEPKLCDDLRRLMNYYLPTTVKLLNAYADLDKQQKSSENIENSKREIEGTIDALNDAFDKLFDDLFVDTSMDISTDVEVMKNMLKQEGLV